MRIGIGGGVWYDMAVPDRAGTCRRIYKTDKDNWNLSVFDMHDIDILDCYRDRWPFKGEKWFPENQNRKLWLWDMMLFGALPAWELAREMENES